MTKSFVIMTKCFVNVKHDFESAIKSRIQAGTAGAFVQLECRHRFRGGI